MLISIISPSLTTLLEFLMSWARARVCVWVSMWSYNVFHTLITLKGYKQHRIICVFRIFNYRIFISLIFFRFISLFFYSQIFFDLTLTHSCLLLAFWRQRGWWTFFSNFFVVVRRFADNEICSSRNWPWWMMMSEAIPREAFAIKMRFYFCMGFSTPFWVGWPI